MATVRSAINRANVIGFDVTTSDYTLTAVVPRSTIDAAGFSYIFKVRAEITGGNAELFPLGHTGKLIESVGDKQNLTDLAASNVDAAQADIVVTNVNRFVAGDYIYIHDNTYTNYEWDRVASLVVATDTLTCDNNFSNAYTVANGAQVGVVENLNNYIPLTVGYIVNEDGLNFQSLYVRKLQADNVRVKGYAVMI